MASNPAFNRIEKDAKDGYASFGGPGPGAAQQAAAGQAATAGMSAQQLQDLYNQPAAGPADTRRVTMDDVIMKTLALFAIVVVFAAAGWTVAANSPSAGFAIWMGGMIGTLVLGLVIAFRKTLSVPLILLYAVVEGLFMGAVSQWFNAPQFQGIVGQAVLATLATFAGMFLAYKFGLIKVTDKFRRIMTMVIIGYAIFALVNFIFAVVWTRHAASASAASGGSASRSRSSRSAWRRSPSPSTSTRSSGRSPPAPRRSTRGSSRTA